MGLAKISGGTYKIADSEGAAISVIIPPPIIKTIDWDTLTDSQTWLISELVAEWEILAHWLVFYRTRAVDIKQMPFTLPDFVRQRTKAELYNSQLDLCSAIWEAIEIRHHYPTPYDWWQECMKENQQGQIAAILAKREWLSKSETEVGIRKLRRSLENGVVPLKNTYENTHLYRLLNSAIKLKNDYKSVRKFWAEYLKCLGNLAKELKSNNAKAIMPLGVRLYYRGERNTLQHLPVQRVSKDTVLNFAAKFAVLD